MHKWNLSPTEAIALQKQLQNQVKLEPLAQEIQYIGGADISFNRGENTVYAGIVVLSLPDLKVVEQALMVDTITFPYIPGLLSFRETPTLLKVWDKLNLKPDVLVLDGHGIAHSRRLGVASHFGLWIDKPTIGCAKKIFVGTHEELGLAKGSVAYMHDKGEVIGAAVRTRKKVKPVYISAGHKITLNDALQLMEKCHGKYRIPEPTRQAHLVVNELRRGDIKV